MGRGNSVAVDPLAKRKDETHAQWQMRCALAGVVKSDDDKKRKTANPFARLHGDYQDSFVTHVETNTRAKATVNRGGTPLARWRHKLTPTQSAAIGLMLNLWERAGIHQRVTAQYGERPVGTGSAESRAASEIEAREALHRIQGYFLGLEPYWRVFENVCRHDMPAGVAGSELGFSAKGNETRAHLIVCFVADIIATRERI